MYLKKEEVRFFGPSVLWNSNFTKKWQKVLSKNLLGNFENFIRIKTFHKKNWIQRGLNKILP